MLSILIPIVLITIVCTVGITEGQNTDMAPLSWQEHWREYKHTQNLSRVYIDDHVVVYFDQGVNKSITWPFSPISKAWSYVKNTYGSFGPDPHLYVILHSNTYDGCHTSSFMWDSHDFRNVIDCGQLDPNAWNRNSSFNFEMFMSQIGIIVQDTAKGTDHFPAQNVCKWTTHEIIYYDIYLHLRGESSDTARLRNKRLNILLNFPHARTYWFRDWFFPIYTNYGGASVLDNFFNDLVAQWPRNKTSTIRYSYTKQMNMGEFIHFWSNAAGDDLEPLARQAFGWTTEYMRQLKQAKKDYPRANYSVSGTVYLDTEERYQPTIIGFLSIILLVSFCAYGVKYAMDRKKIQRLNEQIRNLTTEEVDEFMKGNTNVSEDDVNAPILTLPFNSTNYEICSGKLVINKDKVLGSGEFGLVMHGMIKCESEYRITFPEKNPEVAVKTVKPNVDVIYFKALLYEIKILAFLGRHENIVSLLGTVTTNIAEREVFIALEFCAKGDLLRYLQKGRQDFLDLRINEDQVSTFLQQNEENPYLSFELINSTISTPKLRRKPMYENLPQISTLDLLQWSTQICNGMAFLASKNVTKQLKLTHYNKDNHVVHGDLAARNILLTSDNVAKISDFGLSRRLINFSNYKKTSTTPLPWRWLAIETLSEMTFSTQSDVWSFGVTLWEIFSLGAVPYSGMQWDHNFVNRLIAGIRLNSPEFGNSEICALMKECWKKKPAERISFPKMLHRLKNITSGLNLPFTDPSTCSYTYISVESVEAETEIA